MPHEGAVAEEENFAGHAKHRSRHAPPAHQRLSAADARSRLSVIELGLKPGHEHPARSARLSPNVSAYMLGGFVVSKDLERLDGQHARLDLFHCCGGRVDPFFLFRFRAQHDRHRLGVYRPDEAVGLGGQEAEEQMRAGVGLFLRAIVAGSLTPDAGERENASIRRGKPTNDFRALWRHVLVFAEGSERDETAMRRSKQRAPVRALHCGYW